MIIIKAAIITIKPIKHNSIFEFFFNLNKYDSSPLNNTPFL